MLQPCFVVEQCYHATNSNFCLVQTHAQWAGRGRAGGSVGARRRRSRRHQPTALKPCRAAMRDPVRPHQCERGLLLRWLWRIVLCLRPRWAGATAGQRRPPARCLAHTGCRPAWQPGAGEAQGTLHRGRCALKTCGRLARLQLRSRCSRESRCQFCKRPRRLVAMAAPPQRSARCGAGILEACNLQLTFPGLHQVCHLSTAFCIVTCVPPHTIQ